MHNMIMMITKEGKIVVARTIIMVEMTAARKKIIINTYNNILNGAYTQFFAVGIDGEYELFMANNKPKRKANKPLSCTKSTLGV